ncbi:electron transfer flavoprotein subunit alpha/FixB family protein [Sporolactobacillus sp. CQH2019]|uniref:electron transfer flavoprotein subunit alpha/FixB family protein n=1 Tax=Sporolactobacillus sp. CQH2019 TaxID=3023512 RepID=UPI00236744C2|nr:electron transfer flavoprotein subunit alpha/FixB family protein [Sporolactobacillus sp. CQH2019]MDD9149181.1 electron transfer flavoprotein subunit alpha/FixB family protein [Sporolactobacillus sp. CQH2019]
MGRTTLVFTEQKNGRLRNVSFESLTAAARIAEGGEVAAVLFGGIRDGQVEELGKYGADRVYAVVHDDLKQYTPDAYKQAMLQVIEKADPAAIVLGHTGIGKDIAPRLAARLGLGLITDCTDVQAAGGDPIFVRPIFAGKAFQKKKFTEQKLFVTIRPNNIQPKENERSPEVIPVNVEIRNLRSTVKEVVRRTAEGVDLSEAKVVVSGGRGIKNSDGFKPLQELADVLGGAIGASRAACDAGYCDYALQIGQTGKVVTPELYIACGISGAIQHLAGMSQSKVIVAINKDPEAPIFQVADYGIVGDLFEVVPKLTEAFKKVLSEKQ